MDHKHPNDKRTTGQFFFVDQSSPVVGGYTAPDGSNRRVLMVLGVIAVPADCPIQDQHMHIVIGGSDLQVLTVLPAGEDLRVQTRGMGAAAILTAGIWRV